MGPITLFDKSFIQSLNAAEAVWFDHFFLCNIAPPFLAETLADIHKTPRPGKTAEDEVRIIAEKSPENGCPGINTFHRQSVAASLVGHDVPMTGQVLISSGKRVTVDGKSSTIVEQTPEAEAFQRWQAGKFTEVEKLVAAKWRAILEARPSVDTAISFIAQSGLKYTHCKSLAEVKKVVDNALEGHVPTLKLLEPCFFFHDIGEPFASKISARLRESKYIPLRWFAPYAAFALSVDLLFNIGMKLNLISSSDPHTKTDFSYFYYLPFCHVFVSSDRIHRTCAPLFLRNDQRFIWGTDLKTALAEINAHYLKLPEPERKKGLYAIAPTPPKEAGALVRSLWSELLAPHALDKRHTVDPKTEHQKKMEAELLAHMKGLIRKAKAAPEEYRQRGESESMLIQRKVRGVRGGWQIFSQEVLDSKSDDES